MPVVRLLVAMLGAPVAWAVHLLVSYAIVGVGCMTGLRGTVTLLTLTTVVCALAAVGAGSVAYRDRRGRQGSRSGDAATPSPRAMLLDIGLLASGVFLLVILTAGLGPFLVPLCPEAAP
jgi:small-conductance mechanosensitive channel